MRTAVPVRNTARRQPDCWPLQRSAFGAVSLSVRRCPLGISRKRPLTIISHYPSGAVTTSQTLCPLAPNATRPEATKPLRSSWRSSPGKGATDPKSNSRETGNKGKV